MFIYNETDTDMKITSQMVWHCLMNAIMSAKKCLIVILPENADCLIVFAQFKYFLLYYCIGVYLLALLSFHIRKFIRVVNSCKSPYMNVFVNKIRQPDSLLLTSSWWNEPFNNFESWRRKKGPVISNVMIFY